MELLENMSIYNGLKHPQLKTKGCFQQQRGLFSKKREEDEKDEEEDYYTSQL